jgi:hypothetical protein
MECVISKFRERHKIMLPKDIIINYEEVVPNESHSEKIQIH